MFTGHGEGVQNVSEVSSLLVGSQDQKRLVKHSLCLLPLEMTGDCAVRRHLSSLGYDMECPAHVKSTVHVNKAEV